MDRKQISFSIVESTEDATFLDRVALALELAAIEGLDELNRPTENNRHLRDQAMAASFRTFGIRRLLPVPDEANDRLFFVLKLSAMACCGDRWADLRHWYWERGEEILKIPKEMDSGWDQILLCRLFDCWIRLFRKQGRINLDRIREIITGLRNDQRVHEARLLQEGSKALNRVIAMRLPALYNWAKATEMLAAFMLQEDTDESLGLLHKHFEAGIRAAGAAEDTQLEVVLRWLCATASMMAANSQPRASDAHT